MLYFDYNAAPKSLACIRSDDASKLRTFVPKRRADDYSFQSAAFSICLMILQV